MSNDILGKPELLFKDYYVLAQDDLAEYKNEFGFVAFKGNSFASCMNHLDAFFADNNTDIPRLNAENAKSPSSTNKVDSIESLGILDYVYLQNMRLFFRMKSDMTTMEMFATIPEFSFVFEPISRHFKMATTPLSKQLASKEANMQMGTITFGYFTFDQMTRLIPLSYDDEKTYEYPIVGFWTTGLIFSEEDMDNSLSLKQTLWGLASYFLKNTKITLKLSLIRKSYSFIYVCFNGTSSPRYYKVKKVDMSLHDMKFITLKMEHKLSSNTDIVFDTSLIFKQAECTIQAPIDKEANKSSLSFTKSAKLDVSEIGIQAEAKDPSFEMEKSFMKYVKQNENFYRETLGKMQEQINLLSQAVLSINQTLSIMNLNNTQSIGYMNTLNRSQDKRVPQMNFPDITHKSLSISESSNPIILPHEEMKISKTLSEVRKTPKHKRYRTEDVDLEKESEIPNFSDQYATKTKVIPANESTDDINKSLSKPIDAPGSETFENPKMDITIKNESADHIKSESRHEKQQMVTDQPEFSNEEPIEPKEEDKEASMNDTILQKIHSIDKNKDFLTLSHVMNNNSSIPLPKIHSKFKIYDNSSCSEDSDAETRMQIKKIKQAYLSK